MEMKGNILKFMEFKEGCAWREICRWKCRPLQKKKEISTDNSNIYYTALEKEQTERFTLLRY